MKPAPKSLAVFVCASLASFFLGRASVDHETPEPSTAAVSDAPTIDLAKAKREWLAECKRDLVQETPAAPVQCPSTTPETTATTAAVGDPVDPETLAKARIDRTVNDVRRRAQDGDITSARATLEDALSRDPSNPQLLAEMGLFQLSVMERPREAVGYLEQAIQGDATNAEAISAMVQAARLEGYTPEYVDRLRGLGERMPEVPGLQLAVGDVLSESGRLKEALAHYEKAFTLTNGMPAIGQKIADIQKQLGNARGADHYLEQVSNRLEEQMAQRQEEGASTKLTQKQLASVSVEQVQTKISAGQYEQARELIQKLEGRVEEPVLARLRSQLPQPR